ncbi:MAG: hypothetical protein V4724_26510 [Pseudomonadota bacterium]
MVIGFGALAVADVCEDFLLGFGLTPKALFNHFKMLGMQEPFAEEGFCCKSHKKIEKLQLFVVAMDFFLRRLACGAEADRLGWGVRYHGWKVLL